MGALTLGKYPGVEAGLSERLPHPDALAHLKKLTSSELPTEPVTRCVTLKRVLASAASAGGCDEPADAYARALELCQNMVERRFLHRRLAQVAG